MSGQMSNETNNESSTRSLLDRCVGLSQLLENYDQLQRKTQIRNAYMNLASTLAKEAGNLKLQAGAYLLLLRNTHFDGGDTIIAAMDNDPVSSVRFALQNFREAFEELKYVVRQSEEQEWAKLLAEMTTLTKSFKQYLESAWEIYIKELRDSWFVNESLLEGQMHIDERKIVFDAYLTEKKRFEQATNRIPLLQQDLDLIHQHQERLLALRRKMDLKMPPAVNEFLMASGRGKGALLHLLTSEVLTWLQDNDDVSRYRIKRG
jgi:hypothetical protein